MRVSKRNLGDVESKQKKTWSPVAVSRWTPIGPLTSAASFPGWRGIATAPSIVVARRGGRPTKVTQLLLK